MVSEVRRGVGRNLNGNAMFASLAVAVAVGGCGGSAKPLTLAEWYRGEDYCGKLKLEALLRSGPLTAAERAIVRSELGNGPSGRPPGPVNCALYKIRINITSNSAGFSGSPPPRSLSTH